MRHWGFVITGFYIVLLACLSPPLLALVVDEFGSNWTRIYQEPFMWGAILLWIAGPAILLCAKVDITARPRRRRHVVVSAIGAGLALALLLGAAILNLLTALQWLAHAVDYDPLSGWSVPITWLVAWAGWAVLLVRVADRAVDPTRRMYHWLVGGSVMELLITVPTHLVVRRQARCTDPVVTGLGVVTGLAILLMSVGPAVYFLYRARASRYGKPRDAKPRPDAD